MIYDNNIHCFHSADPCVVTFGKFDGLHRGHILLVDTMKKKAEEYNLKSVFTVLDPLSEEMILTSEERRNYVESQVDFMIETHLNEEIKKLSADSFIRDIIVRLLHAKIVVVGSDFRFGYGRSGDAIMLKRYGEALGFKTIVLEKIEHKGCIISSTLIKDCIKKGDVTTANEMLGYRFSISGRVIEGNKLGRQMGFPTINVKWPKRKVLPRYGVYCCLVRFGGKVLSGIGNIGIKPTVSDSEETLCECHLFDFHEEIYHRDVVVELLKFIRPEIKFSCIEELQYRIEADKDTAKRYFHTPNHPQS